MNEHAIVLPGQGSQKVGMLSDYYEQFNIVRSTFEESSKELGFDLWDIIQNKEEVLSQTEYTQPALLASSVAIYRLLLSKGLRLPSVLAGHSLGEYSALVCANSITFGDALRLVKSRGKYMQEAVPKGTGGMSAIIGLTDEQVRKLCLEASLNTEVSPANYNSPGQVVISGEIEAVRRANILAKDYGARKAQNLPVSVPSHCALMKPAAKRLTKLLENIEVSTPTIKVVHNADVLTHDHGDDIKEALVKQLYQSVRWTETITKMSNEMDIGRAIECGPGKVLSGLNKRIEKSLSLQNTSISTSLDEILTYNKEGV